jgi:DnaJ-class molecular chaperone
MASNEKHKIWVFCQFCQGDGKVADGSGVESECPMCDGKGARHIGYVEVPDDE